MTLDQLRIFLAVADGQHMTHASTKLGLSQSAVSAAIAALEARHDVRLFDRIGRRIVLTESGRIFLREVRALLNHAETAELVLKDLSTNLRGRLRIHASQTIASYWLPSRLVTLHNQYPEIEVVLTIGNTASVADAVQDGSADIGLVEGEVSHGELRQMVVARDTLVLVMAAAHELAAANAVPISAYKHYTWILRETGSGTRSEFESVLKRAGTCISQLKVALELPSNEAVLAAVVAGQSLTVMSRRAVAAMEAAGWIRQVPVIQADRPFALLTHPDRHATRAKKILLELLCG